MVKVRKISDNSPSTPGKKTFSKNRSFSGIESKKTPKERRKSIATVLPTPFKHKVKKGNEWTITEEVDNDEFAKKRTKSRSNLQTDSLIVSTPKKKKRTSLEKATNKTGVSSLASASKIIQKKKILNTPKKIDEVDVSVDAIKSISEKKSNATSTPVSTKEKLITSAKPKASKNKKEAEQPKGTLAIEDLQKKFNVNIEDIKKAVNGVKKLRSQNPKLKKQLFAERYPLLLQICCVKLPTGHSKILRIPLPHSILTPDDEVCLIVPEVKGIKNVEHEKHVEHYEELFRNKGVMNIKKIMTCHELRTEYETFEQKSRLVDLYDVFLVDGKVSGKVVKKCGKSFYKKRKVPIPVKLQATKLKENIEKSLSKAFFFLHLKGDSYSVQFGHNEMEEDKLVENVYSIIEFLDKQFPGGFENFKGMQIYAPRAISIPIYMSLKSSNDVIAPTIKTKKPKAYKTYKDELTTLYNAEVIVQPTGEVKVKRKKDKQRAQDDEITDLDIIKANKDKEKTDKGETKKKSRKRKQNGDICVGEVSKKKKESDSAKQEESIVHKGKNEKGKVGDVIKVQNKINEKVSTKVIGKKKGPKVSGLDEEDQGVLHTVEKKQKKEKSLKVEDGGKLKKKIKKRKVAQE